MRQAIATKYLGPSNSRGSRIKAIARKADTRNGFPAQALTVPYTYEGTEAEHCKAAKALALKLGWSGLWIGGGNVDENGYVFVNACSHYEGNLREGFGREDRDWFYVPGKEA